jgi:hypothetical protein
MNPQEAFSLATRLAELFSIAPAEREVVQAILEKFPRSTAEAVISRYVQETATFDRGKLRTLLWEEHTRRSRRASPTAQWKDARQAESKAIDELLASIPKSRLERLVDDIRKKCPEAFRFLKSDPLQTDIGKSLIYSEWKHTQAK